MASELKSEKKFDLPPRGDRNADPITDEPGSHPIETGIGAVAAGAASGLAAGAGWPAGPLPLVLPSGEWPEGMRVSASVKSLTRLWNFIIFQSFQVTPVCSGG